MDVSACERPALWREAAGARAQPLSGSPRDAVFSSPRPVFFSSFRNIVFSFKLLLRPLTVDFNLQRRNLHGCALLFHETTHTHPNSSAVSFTPLLCLFYTNADVHTIRMNPNIIPAFILYNGNKSKAGKKKKKKDSNWNVEEFCLKWISTCICS